MDKLDLSNTPVSPAGLRQAVIRIQDALNGLIEEAKGLDERLAALERPRKNRAKKAKETAEEKTADG